MPTLKLVQDPYPSNPRQDDNLSLMVCAHGRYKLGDENVKSILFEKLGIVDEQSSIRELVEKARKKDLIFYSTPLYMYEHGGICLSTSPFSCPFDSGQLGEVIVFNETVKNEFSIKRLTKKKKEEILAKVIKTIEYEVEEYSAYVSGEVFGFQILDDNQEIVEREYGFYGRDFENNGLKDMVPEEFKDQLKNAEVFYE